MKTLLNLAVAAVFLSSVLVACDKQTPEKADQAKVAYVASAIREPFHRPDCKWAQRISSENLQTFRTREEAIKAGHRPCKVCKP
jgi:methylphosphotriester-DNA--protein-cysteine methyltransferase